jgi:hypothetical protein
VPASPAQRLSTAARQLLTSVSTTRYSHRSAIDADSGTVITDCSGLLAWLLQRELPEQLAAIPNRRGRTHPLAADFEEAFSNGATGWQRIAHVQDAQPGDVLAWRYLHPQPGRSSGHVMIIDSAATAAGDGIVAIDVIDSTSAPHDDDSRIDTDGVGRGTIHLRIDAAGVPLAVRTGAQSSFVTHAFAIARPVNP